MRVAEFTYTCDDCGTQFGAPCMGDFAYGEFILVSDDGAEFAYLTATVDTAFDEVTHLVEQHPSVLGKSEAQQADMVQHAFSVACDPSPRGMVYRIGHHPACPHCHSRKMRGWHQPHASPKMIEVPEVSHGQWQALSMRQKEIAVDSALKR